MFELYCLTQLFIGIGGILGFGGGKPCDIPLRTRDIGGLVTDKSVVVLKPKPSEMICR
ncbi:hypothetical protein [Rosenbergiella epipactidis]|uniref:hypothetical protein n=1 Tax=Rosenbergiella epipactidis TaxID=1544694 RepID=UPI001F4ED2EB|nr:hypothetical protein [Rosenbergiella epipactidis]